jgi:putative ABC transport system permease protein
MSSKDFVVLVLLSCLIAIPIGYYFMQQWLQTYQYHTEIPLWIFVVTSLSAFVITMITISYQALRASMVSLVNSLRGE